MKNLLALSLLVVTGLSWAAAPPKATPELIAKGKASFAINCASCHGDLGDGQGQVGKMLKPPPRNLNKEKFKKGEKPADVFKTLELGLEGTMMTSFKQLPEEERWSLVYYVLTTFKKKKL